MDLPLWVWFAFIGSVLLVLAFDLGVFHRKAHVIRVREAATSSAIWVALGLTLGGLVYSWMGPQKGLEYFKGYLLEKSLAVDNIFVFVLLSSFFATLAFYHRWVVASLIKTSTKARFTQTFKGGE